MDQNTRVEHFFVSESGWLKATSWNLTKDSDQAEELVSLTLERFILMPPDKFKKLEYGKTSINQFYLYKVMKTTFLQGLKKSDKIQIDDSHDLDSNEYEESDEQKERLAVALQDEINAYLDYLESQEKEWFAARILRLYLDSGKSYQQLADETKISKGVIFETVKRMKAHLRELFQNQYDQIKHL